MQKADAVLQLADASNFFKNLAANQESVLNTANIMLGMATEAESHLIAATEEYAQQWADLGLAYDESEERIEIVATFNSKLGFDPILLGPALREVSNDGLAAEIERVLLRRERDYTDALINVGRDDFLGDPVDNTHRNMNLLKTVTAGAYTSLRDLFLAIPPELAVRNVHHYKNLIRSFRSLIYLSQMTDENTRNVEDRIMHLETVKDKYDATLFTLRRQLQDFHREAGTVGRGANGEYQVFSASSSVQHPASSSSSSQNAAAGGSNEKKLCIIIVQLENVNQLRARHPQLYEASLTVCQNTITSFANAFALRRTNFTEAGNFTKTHPSSLMFLGEDAYQALAFATELHVELNRSSDWPVPLLQMSKFSQGDLWRGVRARIGINFGSVSEMDVPEATAVKHIEGVHVEKCMRVTALGVAGDTVISTRVWQQYQQELTEGHVPTNRRYQSLRALASEDLTCGKRRGFKRGEICVRLWSSAIQERRRESVEGAEFEQPSFFGIEAGNGENADDDPATPEELLYAKDTEITLLQQELDSLRLSVMKRDSDMEEQRQVLFATISQMQRRTDAKIFYRQLMAEGLEQQLMDAHDAITRCGRFEVAPTPALGAKRKDTLPPNLDGDPSALTAITTGISPNEEVPVQDGGAILASDSSASSLEGGDLDQKPRPPPLARINSGGTHTSSSAPPATFGDGETHQPPSASSMAFSGRIVEDDPSSLLTLDQDRQKKFTAWLNTANMEEESSPQASPRLRQPGSPTTSINNNMKHKNVNLWKQLNTLVRDAAQRVLPAKATVSPAGLKRIQSSLKHGTTPSTVRMHALLRVYAALVRRFLADTADAADRGDQSITDEQFILLFLKLVHPEGVHGNQREYIQLMANSALEGEMDETANQSDEGRLLRSSAGHLAKMFLWLRQFKRSAVLKAAKTKDEDNTTAAASASSGAAGATKDKNRLLTTGGKAGAKGRGGGSITPRAGTLSPPTDDSSENASATSLKEVQRMRDEISALKADLAKVKTLHQQAVSRNSVSVAATKIAKAKAEDSKHAAAASGTTTSPALHPVNGTPNSRGAVAQTSVSPTTESLIAAAAAAITDSESRHDGGPPPLEIDSCGEASAREHSNLGDESSWLQEVHAPLTTTVNGEEDEESFNVNVAGDPSVEKSKAGDGHPQSMTVPVAMANQAAITDQIVRGFRESSPLRVGSPFASHHGTTLHATGSNIHQRRPEGASRDGIVTSPVNGVVVEKTASGVLRVHRAAPFSADKSLKVGGLGVMPTTDAGMRPIGTPALDNAPRSTAPRGQPQQQQQGYHHNGGSSSSLLGATMTGLFATDNGVVQLISDTQFGAKPQSRTGPVLAPLKNNSGVHHHPVLTGVGVAGGSPPALNLSGLQGGERVGISAPETFLPTGMTAPTSTNHPTEKLFFALSAKDVQQQIAHDEEDRRILAVQQQRIQEQLIHLRQLQAENNALMAAAAAIRPDSNRRRMRLSPGRNANDAGARGGGTPLVGISKMSIQGKQPSVHPQRLTTPALAQAAGSGEGSNPGSNLDGIGDDGHGTNPVIDVPSAAPHQSRNQLVAHIVAQHRTR